MRRKVHTFGSSSKGDTSPPKNLSERAVLTESEINEIQDTFGLLDSDKTGKINPVELVEPLRKLGVDNKNPSFFGMIELLAKKNLTEVSFDEFLRLVIAKPEDSDKRTGINRIFDLYDEDKSGAIKIANLKRIARELGETLNNEDLELLIERASSNGKEITREDFYTIMTKKNF